MYRINIKIKLIKINYNFILKPGMHITYTLLYIDHPVQNSDN